MSNEPIYILTPINELFGNDHERLFCNSYYFFTKDGGEPPPCCTLEVCSLYSKTLKEVLADGVVDQADLDRYNFCDINDREDVRTPFVRHLYASLRRFSSTDFFKNFLSYREGDQFRKWFKSDGFRRLTGSGLNSDILGENLLCKEQTPCSIPIYSEKMVMVVHPTSYYDSSVAFVAIDEEISEAKKAGIPTVYLAQSSEYFERYYIEDLNPTYWVASKDGENGIEFWGNEIIATGGYVDHCFLNALANIIDHYKGERLTIRIPTAAVYTMHSMTLKEDIDRLGKNFRRSALMNFCNLFKYKQNHSPVFSIKPCGESSIICERSDKDTRVTIIFDEGAKVYAAPYPVSEASIRYNRFGSPY